MKKKCPERILKWLTPNHMDNKWQVSGSDFRMANPGFHVFNVYCVHSMVLGPKTIELFADLLREVTGSVAL